MRSGRLWLTVSSAVLYAAAYPPLRQAWLMWLALAPLFAAAARVGPVGGAALGILWATIATIGVGWCFPYMVGSYFAVSASVSWLALALLASVLAGSFYAAFGAWVAWMSRRGPIHPVLIGAAWGTCELARGRLLVGWASVAYSQVDADPIIQAADAVGPYGVGVLIAAVNAAIAGLFEPRLRSDRPWRDRSVVAAAVVAAATYGVWRLALPFATGEVHRVAAIQGAVTLGPEGPTPAGHDRLDRYLDLTRSLDADPHLIVWPENAVEFYLSSGNPGARRLRTETRALDGDLLLGGPSFRVVDGRAVYQNSVFLMRRGRVRGRYDKLRLVPVAESPVPLGPVDSMGRLLPGEADAPLPTRAGPAAVFLCFEAMFPEIVRDLVADGDATLLVNPSNDAWFGYDAPAQHYLDISRMRAIESRRYLVRAASTGYSAIVDPHGRVLERGRMARPGVIEADIQASDVKPLYVRWGDAPTWAAVLLTLLATLRRARPRPIPESEAAALVRG